MLDTQRINRKSALLFLLGILFALASPFFLSAVTALGWRIPQNDMASDYLTGVAAAMVFFGVLVFLPFPAAEKRVLLIVWTIKSVVSLGLMLLYEWNYPLDAYWYFDLSQFSTLPVAGATKTSGTELIINILWFLEHAVIRTSSYHAQKVLLSFTALMGIYALFRGIKKHSDRATPTLLLVINLFPSILFWGSILGKDPINLFGICVFYYGALSALKRPRAHHYAAMIFGAVFVYMIRSWLVPVMILPFVILQIIRIRHIATKIVLISIVAVAGLYGMRYLGKSLAIESTEALTGAVNKMARSWQRGGGATEVPELNSIATILKFLPLGMFTALFRPLPGEILHIFGFVSGLENLYMLYLVYRGYKSFARRMVSDPLVYVGISFVLIWSVLYAFVSPQNLGAAVRFKLQVLPIMLVTLLYLAYPTKKQELTPPDEYPAPIPFPTPQIGSSSKSTR